MLPGEFFLPPDGMDSLLESGPAEEGAGMVIAGAARLGIADQYGSAHAAPTGLIGLVVLVAVVVAVILSKRGK